MTGIGGRLEGASSSYGAVSCKVSWRSFFFRLLPRRSILAVDGGAGGLTSFLSDPGGENAAALKVINSRLLARDLG